MAKISKDLPLAEITLRRYEKPGHLQKRELVRKICLSLGLLQPGDSRDVIVDIFSILLDASRGKKLLTAEEITKMVSNKRKGKSGTASSNVRRQLKRLKDIFLVDKCVAQF